MDPIFSAIISYVPYVLLGIVGIVVLFNTFFIVRQGTIESVEFMGKFSYVAKPGLNIKIPFLHRRAHQLSTRVAEFPVAVDTITKDKTSVDVTIIVQYEVDPNNAFAAFYRLTKVDQIRPFVFDEVRGVVPELDLDDLFNNKERIRGAVKSNLGDPLKAFGLSVVDTLVTEIKVDPKVVAEMNEINAEKRRKATADLKAQTALALAKGDGEAQKERERLDGEGIAAKRKAIIDGYKDSVKDFVDANSGVKADEVMALVMQAQQLEMLERVGTSPNAKVVFIPYGAHANPADAIRDSILAANEGKTPAETAAA